MFVSIHELELHRLDFAESLAPGSVDFGPDAVQRKNLSSRGRAELIEENHGGKLRVQDIRVVGNFATGVELKCARCLEPVMRDLAGDFDLLYRPLGQVKHGEEISLSTADSEIGYYQGEGILLEDVLKEQVLLALPLRVLCKEDCKGLCPHCGLDLNSAQCQCKESIVDPRWSALAEIKPKLKT